MGQGKISALLVEAGMVPAHLKSTEVLYTENIEMVPLTSFSTSRLCENDAIDNLT